MKSSQNHFLLKNRWIYYVLFFFIFLSIGILIVTNYSKSRNYDKQLILAEQQVEKNPGQSSILLKQLKTGLLDEQQYARYTIVEARANNLLYKPVSSDTAVYNARDFFIKKNDAPYAALACFVSGVILLDQDQIPKAIYQFLLADEWAQKTNYSIPYFSYTAIPYNLALSYCQSGFYQESLAYAKKAARFVEKENPHTQMYLHEVMGVDFMNLNQPDSSANYYSKALQIAEARQDTAGQKRVLQNLSKLYRNTQQYDKAKELCRQILSLIPEEDHHNLGQTYLTLSGIYVGTNQLDSAWVMANSAKDLLSNAPIRIKIVLNETLANLEEKRGNTGKAMEYRQLVNNYTQLREEKKAAISEETNTQKSSLALFLQRESENRELIQELQWHTYFFGMVALLFLVIIGYLLYWFLTVKVKFDQQFDAEVKSRIEKQVYLQTAQMQRELKYEVNSYREYKKKTEQEKKLLKKDLQFYKHEIDREFETIFKIIRFEIIKSIFQCRDLTILLELAENGYGSNENAHVISQHIEHMLKKVSWEEMYPLFNIQYGQLYIEIKIRFPLLNEEEYRVCCLMCSEFTTDEIAGILRTTPARVEEIKKRINLIIGDTGFNFIYLDNYSERIFRDRNSEAPLNNSFLPGLENLAN